MFEIIVYVQLIANLEETNLLGIHQSDFRKRRSNETALLRMADFRTQKMAKKNVVLVLSRDIFQAFD